MGLSPTRNPFFSGRKAANNITLRIVESIPLYRIRLNSFTVGDRPIPRFSILFPYAFARIYRLMY